MKVSEWFKKEAALTHIALAFAFIATLVGIAIALVNGKIVALAFIPLLVFFSAVFVACYRSDKKTYGEIVEDELREERLEQQ